MKEPVIIRSHDSIVNYCKEQGIKIDEFNEPVVIPEGVTDCSYMFWNCRSFNQPVAIPDGVTDCEGMFECCYSFNQPVVIPKSVTNCDCMFWNCRSFNQPITIPKGVTRVLMFDGCPISEKDKRFT